MGKSDNTESYLEGQLLIAMPSMSDPRFERSVIYMCAHSPEGAMGLIINRQAPDLTFQQLLSQLDLIANGDEAALPEPVRGMAVQVGGPVETGRGFVLHTADYFAENSTLAMNEGICLTATLDILRAIAAGEGPRRALLALGYSGWAPGQLETEIQANGWLHCPADSALVFSTDIDAKYERCLARLGIDPAALASEAGHA